MSAPLILAIHPDRRQAPKIASIARHASAELLLAESMERAIAMLSERLPDLILTPTLLSHRDETALTERLRELGDVAAHVQTLTIPIFETAPSTSQKRGVLSSLRKKSKGKGHAPHTAGCTVDTFAEQVVIYLIRAVEARIARPAVQTQTPEPEPEPGDEAQTQNTEGSAEAEGPAKAGHYVHRSPLDAHETVDALPTIEELSARTPAVPEPDRSVETRMDTITAMVPAASAIELPPAVPVSANVNAIAAIERNDAIPAQDCPAPAAIPRVAKLFMEVRSLERAALGHVVHALPAPAAIETGIERVEALVPLKPSAGDPPVPIPALPPRVADVATRLLRVDADLHTHATAPAAPLMPAGSAEMSMAALAAMVPVSAAVSERMLPAVPTGYDEMSMAAVAAMVPVSTAVSERVLPTPAVVSPLAELQMELPPVTATGDAALLIVPESGGSASIAALAAMTSVVCDIAVDRPLPAPAVRLPTADLPMTLMPAATAFATQPVAPTVPEPDRSIGMSAKVVAAIVPFAADQAHMLAEIPARATRVADFSMQLPSQGVDANTPVLPELPTRPTNGSADAVAAITPLARAAAHHGFMPVPAVTPHIVELPIQLPPMAAAGVPQVRVFAVPQVSTAAIKADIAAAPVGEVASPSPHEKQATSVVEVVSASPHEEEASASSAPAPSSAHKKTKKKSTLQERKAARKTRRKADRLDDVSIFDPAECRFAALVAKLDEVVLRGESSASVADGGQRPQGRKARSSKKH